MATELELRCTPDKVRRELERFRDESERLRGALKQMVYETTHLSQEESDGSHWCKISASCLANARNALKGGE